MIKVFPFRALVPPAFLAAKVACEPYDVISTTEARERANGNPYSFLHVVRSEIDLPTTTDPYASSVYEQAAKNLDAMVRQGWLLESSDPTMYIYRQTYQGREQYGLVCTCDAQQYLSGLIKKHEKTRPDKEDDRTRHMTVCSAHAEPVFLAFRDQPDVVNLIRRDSQQDPLIDFTATDGVGHTVWRVTDSMAYSQAFARVDCLYIADGHHRTAGAGRAASERRAANPNHTGDEEYNRILSVVFPASQLKILPYNRIVHGLNGLTSAQVLEQLREVGAIAPTQNPAPQAAGGLGIYLTSQWWQFQFPAESIPNDPIQSLDVSLLQTRILEPILGVGDPRTDKRIGFVGGIRGTQELERLVDSGECDIAFSMFATSIEELLSVSDAGQIMPPKSTWFEPKLRSGLFVHRFESY